jgi:hypothetical protein
MLCKFSFSKFYTVAWSALVLGLLPVLPLTANEPVAASTETPAVPLPRLEPRAFEWKALHFELPNSIKVFEGYAVNADGQPVRAYYADIDYSDVSLQARAALSEKGRETTSAQAEKLQALVTVNGGYFQMKGAPLTFNTVISDGKVLSENPAVSKRAGKPDLFIARGVFGVRARPASPQHIFDLKWVVHLEGKPIAYPTPLPNTPESDSPAPTPHFPAGGKVWDVREAIGGGPVLVTDGHINLTGKAEGFGQSHIQTRHPRTAIGSYVRDNRPHLILLVVDGRQKTHSMGMSLSELAIAMRDLGCDNALNLDGGGSTTLVVKNQVVNKPSGGIQRAVTSVFAIVPTR